MPSVQKTYEPAGREDAIAFVEPRLPNELDHPHITPLRDAQFDSDRSGCVTMVMRIYEAAVCTALWTFRAPPGWPGECSACPRRHHLVPWASEAYRPLIAAGVTARHWTTVRRLRSAVLPAHTLHRGG